MFVFVASKLSTFTLALNQVAALNLTDQTISSRILNLAPPLSSCCECGAFPAAYLSPLQQVCSLFIFNTQHSNASQSPSFCLSRQRYSLQLSKASFFSAKCNSRCLCKMREGQIASCSHYRKLER